VAVDLYGQTSWLANYYSMAMTEHKSFATTILLNASQIQNPRQQKVFLTVTRYIRHIQRQKILRRQKTNLYKINNQHWRHLCRIFKELRVRSRGGSISSLPISIRYGYLWPKISAILISISFTEALFGLLTYLIAAHHLQVKYKYYRSHTMCAKNLR